MILLISSFVESGISVRTGQDGRNDAFCRPGNCHSPESYLTGLQTDAAAAREAGCDGGRGVAPDLVLHGENRFFFPDSVLTDSILPHSAASCKRISLANCARM